MSTNVKPTTMDYLFSFQHVSAISGVTELVPLWTVPSIANRILSRRRHLNIPLLH